MPDDNRTNGSSGGFDDWLGEDAGPDTDPYAELSDDDPEGEIEDWMAFTSGEDGEAAADDAPAEPEAEALDGDDSQTPDSPSDEAEAADESTAEIDLPVSEDDVTEVAVIQADDSETPHVDFDGDDETAEIPIIADDVSDGGAAGDDASSDADDSGTSVDVSEWDGGGRADTDEIPITAGADVVEASVVNATDASKTLDDPDALVEMPAIVVDDIVDDDDSETLSSVDDLEPDTDALDTGELDHVGPIDTSEPMDSVSDETAEDDDDTGELEVGAIAAAGVAATAASSSRFGDLWDQDAKGNDVTEDAGSDPSSRFDISQDDYLQTATQDHAGLAAAIAQAEEEDTERVAFAAPILGLESVVVGFDDVFEAEGHRKAKSRGSGNLMARVITAVVLIAALAASLVWRPALLL
ncbi:MAG: hypothetical protein ACR2N9_07855, partial [Acidimicrobiia bacterium]